MIQVPNCLWGENGQKLDNSFNLWYMQLFGFLFSFALCIEGLDQIRALQIHRVSWEQYFYFNSAAMHNMKKDFMPRASFVRNHRLPNKLYFCLTDKMTRVWYKVRAFNLDLMQNTTFKFNSELINAVITFILRLSAHKSPFTFYYPDQWQL